MNSKFTTLTLQSSVTFNAANPNAVDKTTPLPFLTWMKYFSDISADPSFLLAQYRNYVNSWFSIQNSSIINKKDIIQNLYLSLFKNIAINYLTQEEKRFIQNVDINSPSEISAILPLLVRKIKDICLYFVSQRENVKHAVYNHNLKGSSFSIDKMVADVFEQSLLDPEIAKIFNGSGITADNIKNKLSIEIEPLYDLETNYYDINPMLPASAYDATGTRSLYFSANSFDFDPNLFVDFDVSVIGAIQSYPVILQELGNNFSVNLDFTATDLQYLKDDDYTSLVNDLDVDNLRLQTLKEALQHFSGSTFYYLSTNSNSNFTYGKLFESDKFSNYLNRRFPSVAIVESDKLATEASIGRFFKPDKLGILNYLSFGLNGQINTLSADHIYVFPDPSIYGNISGLSRTKLETPFIFSEDVSVLKNNNSNSYAFGRAISDFLTKFRGYQSRSESLDYDAIGVSRIQDSTDFFTGAEKTIWANPDAYPPSPYNFLPIAERKQTLLNNLYSKTLYQHKTDIYNNEFALYKEIYAMPNLQGLRNINQGETLTCLTLDGGTFWDSVSGYGFNYDVADASRNQSGVTTNTNGLTGLSAYDYKLQCILLYPEMPFYKTAVVFNITVLDGYSLVNYPSDADVTVLSSGNFKYEGLSGTGFYTHIHSASTFDSGPFQFNEVNASYIDTDRSLIETNLVMGQALTAAESTLSEVSGTLSRDVSLYDQQNIYGDLYFRNYNSTIISSASSALSAVLAKYTGDILNQICYKLKGFDLVLDTAIFETDNYLVFERLVYDYDLNQYTPQPNKIYIEKTSTLDNPVSSWFTHIYNNHTEYNQFSNTWYNEKDKTILVSTTTLLPTLSATNQKQIAVDLYEYDFNVLTKITNTPMCILSLSSLSANIVDIEKPLLTYNSNTGSYVVRFLSKDPSSTFYDTSIFFKLDKNYSIYDINPYTLYPNMLTFSDNFGSNLFSYITHTQMLTGSLNYVGFSGNSLII